MNYKDYLPSNLVSVLEASKPLIDRVVDDIATIMAIKMDQPTTDSDREQIEISMVRDLCIAFGNYILDTDEIIEVETSIFGVLRVDCYVIRNGVSNYFNTRLIHAGGNIQCDHLRYIVDTQLYKLGVNRVAQGYKRRDREAAIKEEIAKEKERFARIVEHMKEKINMTDADILAKDIYAYATFDQLNDLAKKMYETPEKFEINQEKRRAERIAYERRFNNHKELARIEKDHARRILRLNEKLEKLNSTR